jgi:hypothetical protein
MLGHAITNSFSDLASAIGWIGLGIIAYFLLVAVFETALYYHRGGRRGWEEREARDLSAELASFEAQRREAIRCMGGGRRGPGPERVAGPESRERLPFSGRRPAR